jgi:ribonuclease HII
MTNRKKEILNISYNNDDNIIEIGLDEVGRGPMFGRVYTAAVVLPLKSSNFDFSILKDSKKFHSVKKIKEVSEYIKKNCLSYSITWKDEKTIDNDNIRIATFKSMHDAINNIIDKNKNNNYFILVDGKDFIPYNIIDNNSMIKNVEYKCIEGGDNKYCSIAAASILAKVARDEYIDNLCQNNPKLNEYYQIGKNKGYGTKVHLDGIEKYGISCWHRKTFGICNNTFENNEFNL